MELFANIAVFDEDDTWIVGEKEVQDIYLSGEYYYVLRENFNNIGYALTTVFILLIGEDWNWTMYMWVRAFGSTSKVAYVISIIYFVLLMIFGNIVLFSVFTAILLANFEGGDDDDDAVEEDGEKEDDDKDDSKSQGSKSFTGKIMSKETWSECFESFQQAFGKKVIKEKDPDEELQNTQKVDLSVGKKSVPLEEEKVDPEAEWKQK